MPAKKLYFTNDLSLENVTKLKQQGYVIRDPAAWHADDPIEYCDEAAGDVPLPYKKFIVQNSIDTDAMSEVNNSIDTDVLPKTNKDLQEALIRKGVEIPKGANKSTLVELYKEYYGDNNVTST